jgi:ATP-dependent DNA helicase RecG
VETSRLFPIFTAPLWRYNRAQEGAFATLDRYRNLLVQVCQQSPDAVESQQLEVKGWCHDERQLAEKVSEAAACLANAEGGTVLVGIDEANGITRFSPCPHASVTPTWLVARIHDLTVPPVECSVFDISQLILEVAGLHDCNAFAVCLPRTKHPSGHMTVKGISKVRIGKECRPQYTAEDDRCRVVVPHATTDDLSLGSIRWAIEQHHKHFGSPRQQLYEPFDYLVEARLLEPWLPDEEMQPELRVTLAALILFGKETSLSRTLPFFETVVVSPTSNKHLRRNLVESVRQICLGANSMAATLCPSISTETIKELLVNAYVHRCYRTQGPVVVTFGDREFVLQNPGELPVGLNAENLIYCVPVYRNLSLADGARFFGLCDNIGKGIDAVYRSVVSGGFDFPLFESGENRFTARVPLQPSEQFREFVRRRSQSLSQLDEILVLWLLWSRQQANILELSAATQRGRELTRRILEAMCKKLMIEPTDVRRECFKLTPILRRGIDDVFQSDQMTLRLFGES